MNRDDYATAELARLEHRWRETGDLRAVAEAFDLCASLDLPLPQWAHPAVRQALASAFAETGLGGRPGRGGYRDTANRLDLHERRHDLAAWALRLREGGELSRWPNEESSGFPNTRQGAFQLVSKLLRGSPAQGDADAIEKSFNKIQARNRRNLTPR